METLSMQMVLRALPLRHQHLDTLADQLVARVPEQSLSLGINLNNDPLLVYRGYSIGDCFQD
jgi:hypothetical protein